MRQILILNTALILSCSSKELGADSNFRLEHSYQIEEFSRLNGLNAFLIKALYQTSDGNLYIGTDSQLIVHEGENWKEIPPSGSTILIKYMLQRRNGDFLVLSDTNLYLIRRTKSGYSAEPYIDFNDKDLYFSKLLYEANDGSLWIAAHRYVYRLKNGKLDKFHAPESQIPSRSYLHTYFFLENTNGEIAVISYTGEAYRFAENTLQPLNWEGPKEVFKVIPARDENLFYLGTDRGFETLEWSEQTLTKPVVEIEEGWISDIAITADNDIFFSTYTKKVFATRGKQNGWEKNLIKEFESNVFRMFSEKNNAVWMLMENRVYRCQKNPVSILSNSKTTSFLANLPDDTILHGDGTKLLTTNSNGTTILHSFESPITTACYKEGQIAVSLQNGEYCLLDQSGAKLSTQDIGEQSTHLHFDENGNVWGNVLDKDGVLKINFPATYKHFGSSYIPTLVSCVTSDQSGNILVAGNDPKHFLHRWNKDSGNFENIGKLTDSRTFSSHDFGINDITFCQDATPVLASSIGILKQKNGIYEWLELGPYSTHEFLSLKYDSESNGYWATSWIDAFFIQNGEVTHYDNINGLSNVPNGYRNTTLTSDYFWIGTLGRIAGVHTHKPNLETNPPRLNAVILEGQKTKELPEKLSNQQNLYLEFKSPNFGVESTKYKFDLHNQKTDQSMQQTNQTGVLSLNKLEKGNYTLSIWSKGIGKYDWSEPIKLEFTVFSVFEKQFMVSLVSIGLLLCIIMIGLSVYSKANAKRIRILDKLVKERTEELSSKNQLLARSNQVRERMLSIVSHDLRGPIGNISNLQSFIAENLKDGNISEATELTSLVSTETENTYQLLENLLAWASYQGDDLKPTIETLTLKEVVSSIVDLLKQRIIEKELNVEIEIGEITLNTDKNFLNTILRNLISNAVKFSSDKGSIRLLAVEKGSHIQISIIDNGSGMDEDTIEKILDKENFYTTIGSHNETGTGLGITVCVELLEKLESSLEIQSKPGQGTVMSFSLKLSV